MKYTCIDPVEFLYPDITDYKSGTEQINILTPRGSYACAQILLFEGNGSIEVKCEGWKPEVYEMIAIPVEASPVYSWGGKGEPHTPERKAPFEVYDCLKPSGGKIAFQDGVAAVYFSMWIPQDATPEIINATVEVGEISIPVKIEISIAVVPEESLSVLMAYSENNICQYHKVERNSADFMRLDAEYLLMMRRMRQNGLEIPCFPVVKVLGENQYEFDFSDTEAYISKAESVGFNKFSQFLGYKGDGPHLYLHGLEKPAISYEGYCYLAQHLCALKEFIAQHGLENKYLLAVCDEPSNDISLEYRALCGIVRKFFPDVKMFNALNCSDCVEGSIDICVPMISEYDRHMKEYDTYRIYDEELWYYDCMGPRGDGYINRFMDYTLLATRYHGWGNYKYDMKGYHHWAVNRYLGGQNPFKNSCTMQDNETELPAGDTHIVYPGENGPWMSVRLENYRAGFEEYEMLRVLAQKDKKLADDICASVFRSFKDVEYDPLTFRSVRNVLIRAMEEVG